MSSGNVGHKDNLCIKKCLVRMLLSLLLAAANDFHFPSCADYFSQ